MVNINEKVSEDFVQNKTLYQSLFPNLIDDIELMKKINKNINELNFQKVFKLDLSDDIDEQINLI
jgi:hypothetical protein